MKNAGVVVGVLVAVLFWLPWEEWLGLPAYVHVPFLLVAVAALVVAAVWMAIQQNLPAEPTAEPVEDGEVPSAAWEHVEALENLGFVRTGPALLFDLQPQTLLVPLLYDERRMWGTVMHVFAPQPKTAFDVVTLVRGRDISLTSSPEPGAGVLPVGSGELLQILRDHDAAGLVARHEESVAYLTARGLAPRVVRHGVIDKLLCDAMRRKRALFGEAPLRHTLVALWRTISKRTPFLGPIEAQEYAQAQLAGLDSAPQETPTRDPVDADV